MSASRYPVRWGLVAVPIVLVLAIGYGGYSWLQHALRGDKFNAAIVASLEAIRTQASVGVMGRAVEAVVGNHGWRSTRHDRALTEKLLTAQWMTFGADNVRPEIAQFETSIEVNPPGDVAYRSRFPCGYRLRMFFLVDGGDRVVQVIEAQHPICL